MLVPPPADLLVWGYFAVLRRLQIGSLPVAPREGAVGVLDMPTMTCDAPLVAMRVAESGHRVEAAVSHPGAEPLGELAILFLKNHIAQCYISSNCGSPFHLHLVLDNGEIRWFSDPTSGTSSLKSLDVTQLVGRWLYVDAYPWLAPVLASLSPPIFKQGLFVNLGATDSAGVTCDIPPWRAFAQTRTLVCQISAGRAQLSENELISLARLAVAKGADLAVVTAGKRGLAIANVKGACFSPSPIIASEELVDASGAGAAVSATLLDHLLAETTLSLKTMADLAVEAGRAQCLVPGALSRGLYHQWEYLLQCHANEPFQLSTDSHCHSHP